MLLYVPHTLDDLEPIALKRLAKAGLTLASAIHMPDHALLRLPFVGRKTLRYIRAFQGPRLPLPAPYVAPLVDDEDEGW